MARKPVTEPDETTQPDALEPPVSVVVTDRLDHDGVTYGPGDVLELPTTVADHLYRLGVVDPTE